MKSFFTLLLLALPLFGFAQLDTIYTNTEKIACTVKEVTADAVQFVYPGETLSNSLYKNTISKIAFRSGRTQLFSESTSLNTIRSIEDFDKVTITQVEGDTKGLFKLGEVSSSARGGSVYSNVDKVKERAMKKLKMEAAMRGANLVYMAYQKTDGNQYGGYFQAAKAAETIYTGVAYSNVMPNKDEFLKRMSGISKVVSPQQIVLMKGMSISKSEYETINFNVPILINRSYIEGGQIYLEAKIQGFEATSFRVVRFDDKSFSLLNEDKKKVVNFIVPFN
ncbi:hypothetical protein [Spirosoma pollinicola]|uniref:DUF4138 domain-containing protein n=1 Tax=Spirosoma pollinicola TaxID=2057025 RepID=A0A2K8YTM1_9BACT|nr:hypothetical protein [Spirosoma pollinicola]AUD00985.1 hypothetical protein CWM47_03610 [Spirosoma pollinicola]